MSVTDWGAVFCGNTLDHYNKQQFRPQPDDYQIWLKYLAMSATAESVLQATECATNFFEIEKDLAVIVPKQQQVEFFYSLKNGFVAPNCPAQFIYFAKAIYDMHRICNLIGPMLPREVGRRVTARNYFGAGYSGRDAICNFVNKDFQPITNEQLIVRCGDWYEAFIPESGIITALPVEIGKLIQVDDVYRIEFTPGIGLTLDGHPLVTFGNGVGGVGNFYDLRRAI